MKSTLTQSSPAMNVCGIDVPPDTLFRPDPGIIYIRLKEGAVCVHRVGCQELLGLHVDENKLNQPGFFENCTICPADVVVSLSNG